MSLLSPLRSTVVSRFFATMRLSDSRQKPATSYLFPLTVLLPRVSQVSLPIFPRALPPPTPKSPTTASARCFIAGSRLHRSSADWPLLSLCNEAETGSLALRLACSPRKASPVKLLPLTLARLLVERAIYKISSFQNIRLARLILALPKTHKRNSFTVLPGLGTPLRFASRNYPIHRSQLTAKGHRPIGFAVEGLRRALYATSSCGIRVETTSPPLISAPAPTQPAPGRRL